MAISRVILEPFDGESGQHAQRLHAMVEEMGWSQDRTDPIIQEHREGRRAIFWIALHEDDGMYETAMEKLQAAFEHYKEPLISRRARLATSGSSDKELSSSSDSFSEEFIPIGNIGLSMKPLDHQPPDAATFGKIITVAGFYVSRILQGTGIGTAALSALEIVAGAPPLSAKALVLYVLSKETEDLEGLYASIERPYQASKQDFYGKRGFEVYYMLDTPKYVLPGGHTWPMKWAYMKKMVKVNKEAGRSE